MTSNLMKLVASSVAIANHAGNVIRTIMRSGELAVVNKAEKSGKFDPQTEADRTAQSVIIGSLSKLFPGLTIIGEEEDCDTVKEDLVHTELDPEVLAHACPDIYKDLNVKDLVVWVDPLDGTTEFTLGHVEHVTILIGISSGGKAIAGIIHQPFFSRADQQHCGRTIWGVIGIGSFGLNRVEPPFGRRVIVTTLSHLTPLVQETIDALDADEVLRVGGCGFKVLQVIEGVADAYVFATPGTKKWDTCGPEAVMRALGGHLTNMLNDDINYGATSKKHYMNWRGLLATYTDHESYALRIPEAVKQSLKDIYESKMK